MPKERISGYYSDIYVGWNRDVNSVQIGVDLGSPFKFVNDDGDAMFTSLWVSLTNKKELDRLIKVLKKARRKTMFGE